MGPWSKPPGGFTQDQLRHRRRRRIQVQIAVLVISTLSVGAVASYRWVATVTPVDQEQAVGLFREQRRVVADHEPENEKRTPEAGRKDRRVVLKARPRARRASASLTETPGDAGGESPRSSRRQAEAASAERGHPRPEEGVYSWSTEGYEQVSGARRQFPEETQRIITLDDDTWTQHHYFSEERQIWTVFEQDPVGVSIKQQRNKVTFGPVTRESKIDFDPPMLAAPRDLRVGYAWDGKWAGDTHGDYSGKVFHRSTMEIGGERVEVWGMTYVINLRGEQEGQVNAEVWFAPEPGLTVKEHYVQDVESGGARYHAEWEQTLKSLTPQQ